MVARQRRRPTREVSRVAAILFANGAALAVLWALLAGPAEDGRSERPALASAAPAPSAPGNPRGAAHGRRAAAQRLRAIVRESAAQAQRETKGRVRAGDVHVAVHVRELGGSPTVELALDADRAQPPASNMKLVTTAAALVMLGPDWHFETVVEAGGPLDDGLLRGDLVVRAGGDPLFDPLAAGAVDGLLAPLVEALRARGLREVEGDLVLDERDFAQPAAAPGWPDAAQRWDDHCALAGGFSANRGCLTALVRSTAPGRPANVSVEPRQHGLPEDIRVQTIAGGKLVVRLGALTAKGVQVQGQIPASVGLWSGSFAHPDPVELFGSALRGALSAGGIEVRGKIRRQRNAPGGEPLARLRTPLASTLEPINTDSNNGVADQLFLALGHTAGGSGTRAGAAQATRRALERRGVPARGLIQIDGSGLSRDNRATARQITALIGAVLALGEPAASLFRRSLAVAGESGTLGERMRSPRLRGKIEAKTGFIGGVSALSGVARSDAGPQYVFSILVEYPPQGGLNKSCWKPMQERICELLVGLEP